MNNEKTTPLDSAKVLQKLDQGQVKTKSIIQAEGKAHMREVKVSDEAYEQLKKKAEAEGKTPDEKAAEIVVKKSQIAQKASREKKPKTEKPPKGIQYPVDVRINAYGFLRLSKDLCEDLSWHWDMALKLVKNADGSATLRKAA
jgi:hypothetical protein